MKNGFLALTALLYSLSVQAPLAQAEDSLLAPSADNPAPALPQPEASVSPSAPAATTADTVAPTPSSTGTQATIPLSSLPGKTTGPSAQGAAAPSSGKDIYQEYEDYLQNTDTRMTEDDLFRKRALFAHEDGSWQLGLTYFHKAFGDFDFSRGDRRFPKTLADTSGPGLSVLFFPVRSLTFGRFGFGPTFSYFWSSFTLSNANGEAFKDKPKNGSMYAYGIKAVYEFDYFLGQILVPYAFLTYDQMFVKGYSGLVNGVKSTDFPSYRTTNTAFGGGVHFNLNRVEPVVASKALANVGIRKFYVTYAATQRSGEFSGLTHSLGLTFEF